MRAIPLEGANITFWPTSIKTGDVKFGQSDNTGNYAGGRLADYCG